MWGGPPWGRIASGLMEAPSFAWQPILACSGHPGVLVEPSRFGSGLLLGSLLPHSTCKYLVSPAVLHLNASDPPLPPPPPVVTICPGASGTMRGSFLRLPTFAVLWTFGGSADTSLFSKWPSGNPFLGGRGPSSVKWQAPAEPNI